MPVRGSSKVCLALFLPSHCYRLSRESCVHLLLLAGYLGDKVDSGSIEFESEVHSNGDTDLIYHTLGI